MMKLGGNILPTIDALKEDLAETLERFSVHMGQGDTDRLLKICDQLRKLEGGPSETHSFQIKSSE